MRRSMLAVLAIFAGSACDMQAPATGDSSSGTQVVHVARKDPPAPDEITACATMRDVARNDLVAVDGDVLYHLDEGEGLGIVDVSNVARPREIARVASVGTPLALYVRPPTAWVAYVDWDARRSRGPGAATVVRAIDIQRPDAPRAIGEVVRPGIASGTALVGGVFYVLGGSPGTIASVRAFGDRVAVGDELALEGDASALAASPAGLAAVTTTPGGVAVSWIDLPIDSPGALVARGTRRIGGGFPAWERDVVSADEGQAVRLLTCATPSCRPEDSAFVRVIDFSGGSGDVRASLPIGIGTGIPVAHFADDYLYVADGSQLRIVKLHPSPRVVGTTKLEGVIAALSVHGSHLVAIGTVGTPSTRVRVAVHDVDVRTPSAPRLRGTATFGNDWTWSPAADDDRAISVDRTTDLLAVPFSTWRASDGRYATGAQVLALGARAPALREALPAEGHVERAVFVRGRLLAVGGGVVTTLEERGISEIDVR